VLLVPRFNAKSYVKLLKHRRPNYIAGVPTLFEALLRLDGTEHLDLSPLRGVFSGGDALSPELRRRVDEFLYTRGSTVPVREGYGLTECVTASCLTPETGSPEGSIGLPFPDTLYKIVEYDIEKSPREAPQGETSPRELPRGETGEICISGPSVMPGYDDDPDETAQTLRVHDDGRVWLHTGDLGAMDEAGFVYFRGRIKRVIVSSGYNVYPFRVETVLNAHGLVMQSCVVGVADDYRMQRVKAYVVLRETSPALKDMSREAIIAALEAHCRRQLAPFERPREYEIVPELPKTLLGKVAYTKL
jgi:long-chain acyl-CoA synthetase